MKIIQKLIKATIIIILIIIGLLFLDTAQTILFNSRPLIGSTKYYSGYKVNYGIFVSTYTYCGSIKKVSYNFRTALGLNRLYGCEEEVDKYIKFNISRLVSKIGENAFITYNYNEDKDYSLISNLIAGIPTIEKMYYNSDFTIEEAYISARAIEDIAGCSMKDEYDVSWTTAEEFYELWKNSECRKKYMKKYKFE